MILKYNLHQTEQYQRKDSFELKEQSSVMDTIGASSDNSRATDEIIKLINALEKESPQEAEEKEVEHNKNEEKKKQFDTMNKKKIANVNNDNNTELNIANINKMNTIPHVFHYCKWHWLYSSDKFCLSFSISEETW